MNIWNNKVKAAVLFVGIVCVLYGTRPIMPELTVKYGQGRVAFSARPQRGQSAPAYGIDPAGYQSQKAAGFGLRSQSETGGGGMY